MPGIGLDAQQHVVDRPLERAAVDHQLVIEHQHRRLALLIVLDRLIAALAHHVPEQDRALAGVDPVVPGVLGEAGGGPEVPCSFPGAPPSKPSPPAPASTWPPLRQTRRTATTALTTHHWSLRFQRPGRPRRSSSVALRPPLPLHAEPSDARRHRSGRIGRSWSSCISPVACFRQHRASLGTPTTLVASLMLHCSIDRSAAQAMWPGVTGIAFARSNSGAIGAFSPIPAGGRSGRRARR